MAEKESVEVELVHIERKKIKERLRYDFTDEEKLDLGAELAREIGDYNHFEDELKDIKSSFKAKIEKAQAVINLLQQKVYAAYEYRLIDCEMVKDFDEKEIYFVRLDNGDIFDRRTMTQDELQRSIT